MVETGWSNKGRRGKDGRRKGTGVGNPSHPRSPPSFSAVVVPME